MKASGIGVFKLIGFCVGILALFMIFLPALGLSGSDSTLTGLQISFGHEFANFGSIASGQLKFNLLNLLAFLLPVAGSLLLGFSKRGNLFAAIAFGVAAVLLFLVPQFTVITVEAFGTSTEIEVDWTYGIGLIVAGSLSVVGLLVSLTGIIQKE